VLKKYVSTPQGKKLHKARLKAEAECCVHRVSSEHNFDLNVQLFELSSLMPEMTDPRLRHPDLSILKDSDAVVVNIDYPLGMAAYIVLSHFATRVRELRGVYLMGKAASLNGVIGDVMIPSVVFDEHSQNTFLFQNSFAAGDLDQDLQYGTVMCSTGRATQISRWRQGPISRQSTRCIARSAIRPTRSSIFMDCPSIWGSCITHRILR